MTGTDPAPETAWYLKPWFLASAGFLALIIALSVVIVVFVPDPEVKPLPTGGASEPAATEAAPADPEESVCGLPAGDQEVPKDVAPVTVWERVGGATVPYAQRTFGPGAVSSDVPSCFAHNPTGALYAAGNMGALVGALKYTEAADLAVPGDGAEAMRAWTGPADITAYVAGYQFLSYTDDLAVVSVAFAVSNGASASWPMTLEWIDGDWRVQVADDGTVPLNQLENLTGYVGWSGVN